MILYTALFDLLSHHNLCDDAREAMELIPISEVYGVETLNDKTHIHAWDTVEGFLRSTAYAMADKAYVVKSDWHYGCDDDCGSRARMVNTNLLLSVK